MSRIFISHSSTDNTAAIALRDWLVAEGWSELFLDLDPQRGIATGERWEQALNQAALRCEVVLFVISRAWLSSRWCMNELTMARRLNKRLFGLLVEEDLASSDLPVDVTKWQVVNLASGTDHKQFPVVLPITGEVATQTFSLEGLARLKSGLQRAGLSAGWFAWPPDHDRTRSPYRGLKALEADDAGIFFGREAHTIETIDRLRGMSEGAPPRLLAILGASGAGKSSFLRAGLLPRLAREDRIFVPLPVIRPGRSALIGESGLLHALEVAFAAAGLRKARAELRAAIEGGAGQLKALLSSLSEMSMPRILGSDGRRYPPTIVISVDQAEELFLAEAQDGAKPFLLLLRDLLNKDPPAVIAVFTIRSDNYERLQTTVELDGVHQETINLPPMPRGSYAEVIKGPARRLDDTVRSLKIDDALVHGLLTDIDRGGAKDALPLLAFTLERLYDEYGATGHLKLEHYDALGRIKGSIEAAVERAFNASDDDNRIPRDKEARLALLRRGLIPWLAGIDPDTGAPRRRVARLSEIPTEARPLVDRLIEQRLLSTDEDKQTGEKTIEPAHDALLRQWGLLQGWLREDAGLLTVLDGIKRASRDWASNGKAASWLAHVGDRLRVAERLTQRPDLAANLEPTDQAYVVACQQQERVTTTLRKRAKVLIATLSLCVLSVIGLAAAGVLEPSYLKIHWRMLRDIYVPSVLSAEVQKRLAAGDTFQECASCPEMIIIPSGEFVMGASESDTEQSNHELPRHKVHINSLAVGKFKVTFDEWDGCVAHGGCRADPVGAPFGRGRHPVINVSWSDAQMYVKWLSTQTGKRYRLLSEAEWEFAARANSTTRFWFGDNHGQLPEYAWFAENSGNRTHAVDEKNRPNPFGLHDVHGNVWEWVDDCYHDNYENAPVDGTARTTQCQDESHVIRGGSWGSIPANLRSAARQNLKSIDRLYFIGFRVARTLGP